MKTAHAHTGAHTQARKGFDWGDRRISGHHPQNSSRKTRRRETPREDQGSDTQAQAHTKLRRSADFNTARAVLRLEDRGEVPRATRTHTDKHSYTRRGGNRQRSSTPSEDMHNQADIRTHTNGSDDGHDSSNRSHGPVTACTHIADRRRSTRDSKAERRRTIASAEKETAGHTHGSTTHDLAANDVTASKTRGGEAGSTAGHDHLISIVRTPRAEDGSPISTADDGLPISMAGSNLSVWRANDGSPALTAGRILSTLPVDDSSLTSMAGTTLSTLRADDSIFSTLPADDGSLTLMAGS